MVNGRSPEAAWKHDPEIVWFVPFSPAGPCPLTPQGSFWRNQFYVRTYVTYVRNV